MTKFFLNFKIIIFIFIIIVLDTKTTHSLESVRIEIKINNEIITNIDIENEYKYLTTLNESLLDSEKKNLLILAKNSLIKEKIKEKEVVKFFDFDNEDKYVNEVIENLYRKRNFSNIQQFEIFLKQNEISLSKVEKKLKIEAFWNSLIYEKYRDQLNINSKKIEEKVDEIINSKQSSITSYSLSEIVFTAIDNDDKNKKYALIKESIKNLGFGETATIYSESQTATKKGKLDWINENQLSSLIKEVKTLRKSEYTKLINVNDNFLLIQLNDTKEEVKKLDRSEEIEKLRIYETNNQLNKFSMMYFNKIKKRFKISEL